MNTITVTRPTDFDSEFDTLTTIKYLWRDADNGKNYGDITIQGAIGDEQAQAIIDACQQDDDGTLRFRTDDVNFEHLAHEQGYEVRSTDPKTHELLGFEVTCYARYIDQRTIGQVVAQFQESAKKQARRTNTKTPATVA